MLYAPIPTQKTIRAIIRTALGLLAGRNILYWLCLIFPLPQKRYPIAKHIKTAKAADITYLIMKPLEYFFVIFLYLFDTKPENRINIQYIPHKKEILQKSKSC